MSQALAQALKDLDKAETEVDRVLKRDYPPGAEVTWSKNGVHDGVVILSGYGDRVKVRNLRTNREFWIHAYTIVEAMQWNSRNKQR